MARRWTVGVLACLVAGAALLAGCSSAQQASQTLPTAKPPAAAPSTASSTLPPLGPADFPEPATARQKTPDGVTAFTNYYVQLINHGAKTLDSQPLRDLSQHCDVCAQIADSYDHAKAAEETFDGGDISIISTGTASVEGDVGDISFYLQEAPVVLRNASGDPVPNRSHVATKLGGGLKTVWDTQRSTWLVTQLDADRL